MDQCFFSHFVKVLFPYSLGRVGFSVAAVQLVPYVSFSHSYIRPEKYLVAKSAPKIFMIVHTTHMS